MDVLTSKSAEQTDDLSTSTFKVKYLGYGVTHIYSNVMGHFSTGVILPHVWHEKNIPWWRKKFLHLRSHYSTSKFDPPPPVIIIRRTLFFYTLQTNRSAFMRDNNCSIIDPVVATDLNKKKYAFFKPKLDN